MYISKTRIKNNLRQYRKLRGYSQTDVAKILGFKRTNRISNWEKGITIPNMKNLLKLSILYGTLPQELYFNYYQSLRAKVLLSEKTFLGQTRIDHTFYDDS